MKEFNIGDKVRVNYTGECLPTYTSFFKENGLERFEPNFREHEEMQLGDYRVVGKGNLYYASIGETVYALECPVGNIYLTCNTNGDSIQLIEEGPKAIKAYELIKLAVENPEKYVGKRYKVTKTRATCVSKLFDVVEFKKGKLSSEVITLVGVENDVRTDYVVSFNTRTELEEIKPKPQPVTFIEAVKALDKGHAIRCLTPVHGNQVYSCYDFKSQDGAVCTYEILEGTWYIEEDKL